MLLAMTVYTSIMIPLESTGTASLHGQRRRTYKAMMTYPFSQEKMFDHFVIIHLFVSRNSQPFFHIAFEDFEARVSVYL